MNTRVFLRKVAKVFGGLVKTLPLAYQPAGEAFLRSITNDKVDAEYPVPSEILPTIALTVLNVIVGNKPLSYKEAVEILDKYNSPVSVRSIDYPEYHGETIRGYETHPHYYVMGSFTTYPQGGGYWLVEDRYDWHFWEYDWRVPDSVATRIPEWILNKFAYKKRTGWYLEEVGVLDQLTVPYWHRSIVRLSDYLDPKWFE